MFYTVYKITNLVSGKFYIGKHQTKDLDDGYMGSGKLLKRAIAKYGIENFRKDILEVYDTEYKMNLAERVLVVIDPEISYNLCSGGKGGFGYINENGLSCGGDVVKARTAALQIYGETFFSMIGKKGGTKSRGRTITTEHKIKLLHSAQSDKSKSKRKHTYADNEHQQGSKNSQFGTCWITNGKENRKVKKETLDNLETGWYKGRNMDNN